MSVLSFVDHWLPPPSILRPASLGLDISESSVKYIGLRRRRTGLARFHLAHWGEFPLKPETVVRGEIKNPTALANVVKEIKRRTGVDHAYLSLPEERVYLFETEIDPNINLKDIRELIEFRLEENVPLSPRDAYFDYHLYRAGDKGPLVALVAACPKVVSDSYLEVCQLAGVTPLSFEVESEAIKRAVLPENDHGTRMLLDFGQTRTGLGIVYHGLLAYTSTINVGGNELSAALRRQFGEKEEGELTRLKNEQGLVRGASSPSPSEALLPQVSILKDEIQSHLQYWNEKHATSRPVEEIIICGGTANLRGLPEYLSEALKINASVADVWQNAFDHKLVTPPIDRRHSFGYATAMGLALAPLIERS